MTGLNHRPASRGSPRSRSCRPGLHLFSASSPEFDCYVDIPRHLAEPDRVLVCVHGVSRNALEQVELLRAYAERYGFALVAPLFAPGKFRDYQRLGRSGHGPRADLALIRMLNDIGSATGLETGKVAMFGFSGGAQFVHRFAYAHSQRVSGLVLGSAGWYTMPDRSKPYPFGAADARGLDAVWFNLRAAVRLPTLVVVGADDDREDDAELNRSAEVMRSQGRHRLERAANWVKAMNDYAERAGTVAGAELRVLQGVGHSFRDAVLFGGLGELIFGFCDRTESPRRLAGGRSEGGATNESAAVWQRGGS